MKNRLWSGIIIFLCLSLATTYWLFDQEDSSYLIINGHKVYVELAADNFSRQRGLGGRDQLAADAGLLFLFPDTDNRFFWMKGMKFPIDIIWIKDNKIAGIEPNVPLATGPDYPHYASPAPVDRVLEVNALAAQKWGWLPGQAVQFQLTK